MGKTALIDYFLYIFIFNPKFNTFLLNTLFLIRKLIKGPRHKIFLKKCTLKFDRVWFQDDNDVLGVAKSGPWHILRPKNHRQVGVKIFREKTQKHRAPTEPRSTTVVHPPHSRNAVGGISISVTFYHFH